jgi:ketosteroid isomerase-like protein
MKRVLIVMVLAVALSMPSWAQSAAEQELLDIEEAWYNAYREHDVASFLEDILAPDYVSLNTHGIFSDGEDVIRSSREYQDRIVSIEGKDLQVHITGETAVVTGSNDEVWEKDGERWRTTYKWVDVFGRLEGRWVLVSSWGVETEKQPLQ